MTPRMLRRPSSVRDLGGQMHACCCRRTGANQTCGGEPSALASKARIYRCGAAVVTPGVQDRRARRPLRHRQSSMHACSCIHTQNYVAARGRTWSHLPRPVSPCAARPQAAAAVRRPRHCGQKHVAAVPGRLWVKAQSTSRQCMHARAGKLGLGSQLHRAVPPHSTQHAVHGCL